MKKLLTLTAVLATAFFMSASAQDSTLKVPPIRDSSAISVTPGTITSPVGSTQYPTIGTNMTQLATTAFVSKPPLTVIIGNDTLRTTDTLNIPNQGPIIPSDHIFGIPISPFLQLIIVILGTIIFTVLPAIQAVLKVIPTEKSVLIQGWIGKILNFATGFIKDAKLGGGFHE